MSLGGLKSYLNFPLAPPHNLKHNTSHGQVGASLYVSKRVSLKTSSFAHVRNKQLKQDHQNSGSNQYKNHSKTNVKTNTVKTGSV